MIAIDILHLVDKLEALIEQGHHIPLSAKTIVDEDSLLDIIDQMRISIPEEIKRAERVQEERERIVAEAQNERAQIIAQAHEDAARLVAEHQVRRQAQERAERILAEAERQAQLIRQGADDYAVGVLVDLAEQLAAVQRTTSNGIAALQNRKRSTARASPPEQAEDDPADEPPEELHDAL